MEIEIVFSMNIKRKAHKHDVHKIFTLYNQSIPQTERELICVWASITEVPSDLHFFDVKQKYYNDELQYTTLWHSYPWLARTEANVYMHALP